MTRRLFARNRGSRRASSPNRASHSYRLFSTLNSSCSFGHLGKAYLRHSGGRAHIGCHPCGTSGRSYCRSGVGRNCEPYCTYGRARLSRGNAQSHWTGTFYWTERWGSSARILASKPRVVGLGYCSSARGPARRFISSCTSYANTPCSALSHWLARLTDKLTPRPRPGGNTYCAYRKRAWGSACSRANLLRLWQCMPRGAMCAPRCALRSLVGSDDSSPGRWPVTRNTVTTHSSWQLAPTHSARFLPYGKTHRWWRSIDTSRRTYSGRYMWQ